MCAAAKQAGDAAVSKKDFQEAVRCYTEALRKSEPPEPSELCAALFCNRALAYLELEKWNEAEEDASRVLSDAASGAGVAGFDEPKLRVKALYRRGLAREALKKWQEAKEDLSLALKAAPGNAGLQAACRRVAACVPRPRYVAAQPYHTAAVQSLAHIAGGEVGYMQVNPDICVRFPNGMAVQAHERTGSLVAIREQVTAHGKRPARHVETKNRDFHLRPNFGPMDGLNAEYDVGGNLVRLFSKFAEDFSGPFLTFNADASMSLRESCCYKEGRVVSKLQSDIPPSFIADAFRSLILPVKKALDMGLAPNEEDQIVGTELTR
ncbi:unnamed protein product [Effrenium voratum]|uniref:Uncharacterized protein n=1 Tax=Effrenium voratum TaxID=2562239 RepID=A0AA36JQV7_9DINO|nr:unnamed protein product [Effrenium voratum]